MSLRGKIDFAEMTDTGRVRDHNEDAIGSDPDIGLLVLADGMGGHAQGEMAAQIAVDCFVQGFGEIAVPVPDPAMFLGEQASI